MKITLSNTLPPYPTFVEGIRRAPDRGFTLSPTQTATALKNCTKLLHRNFWKSSIRADASMATATVRRAT